MCIAYRIKNSIEDHLLEYQGDGPKYQGKGGEDKQENPLGGEHGEDHYNSSVHHPLKDASTAHTVHNPAPTERSFSPCTGKDDNIRIHWHW
jgi:hypothetical protein